MWVKIAVLSLLVLAAGLVLALTLGARRWEGRTRELRARLESARVPVRPARFDARELAGLPAPVERYFRAALTEGQPMVTAVSLQHTGTFAADEGAVQWKPFTSRQRVVTRRPGFVWDARVTMAPGTTAHVHDAYVAGEGLLHAALAGLVTVADSRGTPELAQGELLRFFAEAAWYPTALLPSQGVRWEAADDSSAMAALTDGPLTLALRFRFGEDGLIRSVRADSRGRDVHGRVVPTPWEGRFWGNETRNGMRVPLEAEVAWVLPEGPAPYWRGRITAIEHEFEP